MRRRPFATGDRMDDREAILHAKAAQRAAYNRSDADGVVSICSEALFYMEEGAPSFFPPEGREALRLRTQEMFARYRVKMEPVISEVAFTGDSAAFDWGWHKFSLTPRNGGQPQELSMRYLELWTKGSDGDWRIFFLVTSREHEPKLLEDFSKTAADSSGY
jgi:uncharacterized protein (TIGR02246 family)